MPSTHTVGRVLNSPRLPPLSTRLAREHCGTLLLHPRQPTARGRIPCFHFGGPAPRRLRGAAGRRGSAWTPTARMYSRRTTRSHLRKSASGATTKTRAIIASFGRQLTARRTVTSQSQGCPWCSATGCATSATLAGISGGSSNRCSGRRMKERWTRRLTRPIPCEPGGCTIRSGWRVDDAPGIRRSAHAEFDSIESGFARIHRRNRRDGFHRIILRPQRAIAQEDDHESPLVLVDVSGLGGLRFAGWHRICDQVLTDKD
jgi:hypothetical protein